MRSESLSMRRALNLLRLVERGIDQRGPTSKRLGGMPAILRARLHLAALAQVDENLLEALRRQVLVVVLVDLHHWRIDASAKALDLDPGEHPILGDVAGLADQLAAGVFQRFGAAQQAGRGAAELHVIAANRRKIEHGVEGGDLVDADIRHAEQVGDVAECWLRQPAAALFLRPPQKRQHRRGLAALRIFLELILRPTEVLGGKGEGFGLLGGKAADAHRLASSFASWIRRKSVTNAS